eukprot:1992884-Alexandrium_andersonii.AAC.1
MACEECHPTTGPEALIHSSGSTSPWLRRCSHCRRWPRRRRPPAWLRTRRRATLFGPTGRRPWRRPCRPLRP